MSNVSKLQKFNPEAFAKEIKNYKPLAAVAISKTYSENFEKHTISPKERLVYWFCDILDTPRFYYTKTFETLNPQNKVLLNGIFFKNLFQEYLAHLAVNFDDLRIQTKTATKFSNIISKDEYTKMPKHYRGIFMPYDSQHYALNNNYETLLCTVFVKKQDKKELRKLLEYARILLPVVYKTQMRENIPNLSEKQSEEMWLNRTIALTVTRPAFMSHYSIKAQFVSDMQIDALQKLCDIFTKLDNLTQSHEYGLNTKISSNALNLYSEYRNELSNKDRYLNAQKALNKAKKEITGLQTLSDNAKESERDGINVLLELAQAKYAKVHQQIIADVKNRTK